MVFLAKILTSPVFKSDGNLNDLYQTGHSGIYFLNGDKSKFQNSPTGWCILIVLAFGEVAFQLIFKREEIYVRDRTGNPLAWGSWSKATMTYV